MKKTTGLEIIAAELGISVSQASRALNNQGRVATATRERVFAAARRHGYRNTSHRHRRCIALVFEQLHSIYREFINGLERNFLNAGISILVLRRTDMALFQAFAIDMVMGVDLNGETIRMLRDELGVPTLTVRLFSAATPPADIELDHDAAQVAAWRYFQQCGCRKPVAILPDMSGDGAVAGEAAMPRIRISATQWDGHVAALPELAEYDAIAVLCHYRVMTIYAAWRQRQPSPGMVFYGGGALQTRDLPGALVLPVPWEVLTRAAIQAAYLMLQGASPPPPVRVAVSAAGDLSRAWRG